MPAKINLGMRWMHLLLLICISMMSPSCNQNKVTPGSGSFISSYSIPDLTEKSKLILIGQVISKENIINMARNPENPEQPDDEVFVVGQVYRVKVSEYRKGDGPDELLVVQREGFIGADLPKTETEIEKAKSIENYLPLNSETNYLMFLNPKYGYPEGEYYVGTAEPWRFDINNPTRVIPESPWSEASLYFPPQTLENIIEQIDHPELFAGTPQPAPYPGPSQRNSSGQTDFLKPNPGSAYPDPAGAVNP